MVGCLVCTKPVYLENIGYFMRDFDKHAHCLLATFSDSLAVRGQA